MVYRRPASRPAGEDETPSVAQGKALAERHGLTCVPASVPATEVLDFLEGQAVEYVVAMASNARLVKRVRRLMGRARMRSPNGGS